MQNSEQRALAIKYLGDQKLLEEAGGKIIGKDEYGEIYELELLDINRDKIRIYKAIDSAENDYVYLFCWPDIDKPRDFNTRAYRLDRLGMVYEPVFRS